MRPLSSADIATLNPAPSSPSRAESGTRTPSRNSSAVSWARRPSLPSILRELNPSEAVGTRKHVIPRGPSPPVRAKTSATPAHEPSVMKIFEPESTQSPPSRSARVTSEPGSEPAPGSVSA